MQYTQLNDAITVLKLLLKGPPGGGKTYKAAHFPKPAIFNFDNNLTGLKKLPAELRSQIKIINPFKDKDGKDVAGIKVWDNFIKLLEEVLKDPDIRTIIIDSLSTLINRLIDKIVGSADPATRLQIQHYGDLSRYLKWFGDDFLSAPDLDKNVIVIAHEVMVKDELTQSIQYELNIPGKFASNFDMYFTDCWRSYAKQPTAGDIQYRVRVLPTDRFNAKCTLSNLEADFEWDKEKTKIVSQVK